MKWAALVALGAAVVFTGIGALFMQNPLCGGYVDCSVSATGLVYNAAIKFVMAMLFYGLGRGGGAVFDRVRKRPDKPTN